MASREASNLLDQAIKSGDIKRKKRLVNVKNADISKITMGIYLAMNSRHSKKIQNEIIEVLLSHPEIVVNINMSPDQTSSDSLEDGIKSGTSLLKTWIEEGNLNLVKALVKHPKIDVKDASEGISVAIKSVHLRQPSNEKLQIDIIKTLLEHSDIDVNSNTESNGFSVLHVAVTLEQIKTIEALIRHPKIDVNQCAKVPVENHKGMPGKKTTPLIMSMSLNETTDITKVLLEHPNIDVNKTDSDICLPLSLGVNSERRLACFEMLLNHGGIDANAKDQFLKHTPLMCMIQRKEFEVDNNSHGKQFYEEKAIKLLAIMFEETEDESISDHKARFANWYDLIADVLANNPNLITPDEENDTPIDIALGELRDPANLMKAIVTKHLQKIAKDKVEEESIAKDKAEEELIAKDKAEEESLLSPAQNITKCCWNCDAQDVKLYKCTGCKKAYYCSRDCITQDWPVHGGYCVKKQQKNPNK